MGVVLRSDLTLISRDQANPFEFKLDFLTLDALGRLADSVGAMRLAIDGACQISAALNRLANKGGNADEADEVAHRHRAAMLLLSTTIGVVETNFAEVDKIGHELVLDWCTKP